MGFLRRTRLPTPILGFVAKGDSLTAAGSPTTDWPTKLGALMGVPVIDNFAVGGQTVAQANVDYSTEGDTAFNPASADTYLFMMGTNDAGGVSGATIITRIQDHVNLALATGYRVALGTITPRGENATAQSRIDVVNTHIRANYGSMGARWLLDFATWPTLLDPTNATYYSDLLHQTEAGRTEMALAAQAGFGA